MGAVILVAVPLAVVIVELALKVVVPFGANHTLPPVSFAEEILTVACDVTVIDELNTVFWLVGAIVSTI